MDIHKHITSLCYTEPMNNVSTSKKPVIVFVHGLWLHSSSWEMWAEYFRAQGYDTITINWPGESATVDKARQNPDRMANIGIRDICDAAAAEIAKLDQPPVLIGHSFGGLAVQELLGRGMAATAVAIDPAPIKGVHDSPLSVLRSFLPFLINPFNFNRAVMLSFEQFRYGFANAVPEEVAKQLYEAYVVPTPAKPLFEVLLATFGPGKANKVDTKTHTRPLLIIGGEKDHNAPPVFGRSTLKRYGEKSAVEYKEFAGRGHSLTIDPGWEELAAYCARWIESKPSQKHSAGIS